MRAIFILCATLFVHLDEAQSALQNPVYDHRYIDAHEYEGDDDLDFVGDPIAVLEDGSRWKIHPQHVEVFSQWQLGESVHIGLRTDWYWFKREHKFLLVNHDRNEALPVMLVEIPREPLTVLSMEPCARFFLQNINFTIDDDKLLKISDGSQWVIDNANGSFYSVGSPLYIGYYEYNEKVQPIFIAGIEKNAVWNLAEQRIHDIEDISP